MKKQILLSAALLLIGTTFTFAGIHCPRPYAHTYFHQGTREVRHDKREIRRDNREVRGDKRELTKDKIQRNQAIKEGDKRGVFKKQHEVNRDKRELRQDKRERRGDARELHHDKTK